MLKGGVWDGGERGYGAGDVLDFVADLRAPSDMTIAREIICFSERSRFCSPYMFSVAYKFCVSWWTERKNGFRSCRGGRCV